MILILTHRSRGDDRSSLGGFAAGCHTHLAILLAPLEAPPSPYSGRPMPGSRLPTKGSAITTAMSLRSPPVERVRYCRRWLLPTALFCLVPKCVLCLLAYAGDGTVLGLAGPEVCGAASAGNGFWSGWLPRLVGAAGLAGRLLAGASGKRPR